MKEALQIFMGDLRDALRQRSRLCWRHFYNNTQIIITWITAQAQTGSNWSPLPGSNYIIILVTVGEHSRLRNFLCYIFYSLKIISRNAYLMNHREKSRSQSAGAYNFLGTGWLALLGQVERDRLRASFRQSFVFSCLFEGSHVFKGFVFYCFVFLGW